MAGGIWGRVRELIVRDAPDPPGSGRWSAMTDFVVYVALCLAPALALLALMNAATWFSRWDFPRRRRGVASTSGPTLERLVADLRRLESDYRRIECSDLPAKSQRLRAVSLAYDDTLRACCLALELPEPEPAPLSALAPLRTEAELAQHGLTW